MDVDVSDNDEDFTRPKKTSKPPIKKTYQTTTTNKYGIMGNTVSWNDENKKTKWIPPLIVNNPVTEYQKFVTSLIEILGHMTLQ